MALSKTEILNELPFFFKVWSSLNEGPDDLSKRLSEFIRDWQCLSESLISERPISLPELDLPKLQNFLGMMTPLIDAVRVENRNGESANIWGVSGLKRDEVRISSVFAWFLDFHGEHGQEGELFAELLKAIKGIPDHFPKPEDVLAAPYWKNVESCPLGDKTSRIDIEIEGDKFLLFIEVKIDANETNNQLDRYLEIGKAKSGNRPWGILFLTPNGCKPKIAIEAKDDPKLISISWTLISKVFNKYAQSLQPSFYRSVLKQFANYVSKF